MYPVAAFPGVWKWIEMLVERYQKVDQVLKVGVTSLV
jgi:hypothetical protein